MSIVRDTKDLMIAWMQMRKDMSGGIDGNVQHGMA
jgi:hypothetical protein